jgi:large subunit ribosomal protein L4
MTTVVVTSPAGETEGALELPADVFDAAANIPVMHQVVVAQLAAARQGTHSTKTRGAVAGGGVKPYRQKGTGRARQGSIRAPQFVGGGIAHGPVPHGHAQRTGKKIKVAALRGALSDRARGGNVHVVSAVVDGETPSTKSAAAVLERIGTGRAVLVVVTRDDVTAVKSLQNLPSVHVLPADQLNTYDVLRADDVVFPRAALDQFLAASGSDAAVRTGAETSTEAADAAADEDSVIPDDGASGATPESDEEASK